MLTQPLLSWYWLDLLSPTQAPQKIVTAIAFTQKHGHNVRAEQRYHPSFLITNTQYLEVPIKYNTICGKKTPGLAFYSELEATFPIFYRSAISVTLLFTLTPHGFFFFLMPGKAERLRKKTLLLPQASL